MYVEGCVSLWMAMYSCGGLCGGPCIAIAVESHV